MTVRVGGYSSIKHGSRKMLKVFVFPQIVMVGNQHFLEGLGFQRDVSLNASKEFANILYELSKKVAAKQPKGIASLEDENENFFQKSLFIDDYICKRTLFDLGKIGAGLRSQLSNQIIDAFKSLGFLKDQTQEDLAITFVENFTQTNSQAPVLWEMMYEGNLVDAPEWQKFWGLRVPIAHWVNKNRSKEIRLQKTFSAIHEDLKFAGREIELAKKLAPGLAHKNLIEVCRERVDQELLETQDSRWLYNYLNRPPAHNNNCQWDRQWEADQWKLKTLVSIFEESSIRYDLLHFACHCEASNKTEFLSQLIMKVAGESIHLDVALIASALKRKDNWDGNDPGPLVFLNACGTFEQNTNHEPPGFPTSWINSQGALAVIGTLCPVPDYFAYAFARKFYEILFEAIANQRECYLSEALLATRRYFMETYNNPLGLAYVLYAVDEAQVLDDFAQMGDAA